MVRDESLVVNEDQFRREETRIDGDLSNDREEALRRSEDIIVIESLSRLI